MPGADANYSPAFAVILTRLPIVIGVRGAASKDVPAQLIYYFDGVLLRESV